MAFCWVSSVSASQQKVVLLSSLETKQSGNLFRKDYYQHYLPNLEENFRKAFQNSNYIIEIKAAADQFDLWQVLHDPQNVAVFWLSHAGWAGNLDSGKLIKSNKIVDFQGYEVTPIFEKIHPNLRFLAVIGCFSKEVIESLPQLSQDPKHPSHPYLRLFTFNQKVDASQGLKKSIEEAKKVLSIPEIRLGYTSQCPKKSGYSIKISRQFLTQSKGSLSTPAARVMLGQEVVGVFPKGMSGQSLQLARNFLIPKVDSGLPMLRLDVGNNTRFGSDPSLARNIDIGLLKFSPDEVWSVWHNSHGNPIGVTSHSYQVKQEFLNSDKISKYLTTESEFLCDSMPAY